MLPETEEKMNYVFTVKTSEHTIKSITDGMTGAFRLVENGRVHGKLKIQFKCCFKDKDVNT